MKQLFYSVLFAFFFLSANFSSGQGFISPDDGNAAVYFVRVSSWGGAASFEYFEDRQFIGKFKGKNYMRFELPAGKHLLWASSEDKEFLNCDLLAGESYLVLVNIEMGAWKARVGLEPVTTENPDFERVENLIKSKKPIVNSQALIDKTQAKLESRGFYDRIMERYETEWKNTVHTVKITPEMFIPDDKL